MLSTFICLLKYMGGVLLTLMDDEVKKYRIILSVIVILIVVLIFVYFNFYKAKKINKIQQNISVDISNRQPSEELLKAAALVESSSTLLNRKPDPKLIEISKTADPNRKPSQEMLNSEKTE